MKRAEIKSLWRHPNFIKLWAGQTVSLFGSQISLLAIPLTAVLVLNATPLQMGILTAIEAVPYLLFGLVTGVWVEYWLAKDAGYRSHWRTTCLLVDLLLTNQEVARAEQAD
jgi:hypothetical protein